MAVEIKPTQIISKSYLKSKVIKDDIERFRCALKNLYRNYNNDESEEYNKNEISRFLCDSYYKDSNYINTKEKTDLVIYSDKDVYNSHALVLIETKKINSQDMVNGSHLNRKALHQLISYYIQEEIKNRNTFIKNIIATDGFNWFFFDVKTFHKLFVRRATLAKKVLSTLNDNIHDTQFLYNEVIKPIVEENIDKIKFTYLSLDFQNEINDENIINNKLFILAYKLLSPQVLLKQETSSLGNALNEEFYKELLYLIGLEEKKDKQTKLLQIKRLDNNRQAYSIFEQTYSRVCSIRGDSANESKNFEDTLELVLIWINRLLFIKLLESQIVSYKRSMGFMTIERISDFGVLNDLFLDVLAHQPQDRRDDIKPKFQDVPYLNSSLFEKTQLENETIDISNLRNGEVEVYKSTSLKNIRGKKVCGKKHILDYILQFLDNFDFGYDGTNDCSEGVRAQNKTIINASVLGRIFEKINGYKDGAVFTPSYITEYICRETIRRSVVDKFNMAHPDWQCADFEDLKDVIETRKPEDRKHANEIVNSLRICDPAVGSGHFLVSALNEIISIKGELGILVDDKNKRVDEYDISIENDELTLINGDGEEFLYDPSNVSSSRVQKTLFEEKKQIISHCLYGVDINPKSVNICCLRLWIELLKNAYYMCDESGQNVLQTLPNIDINIKKGNSLVSHSEVHVGKSGFKRSMKGHNIRKYKEYAYGYKDCKSKEQKKAYIQMLNSIKSQLYGDDYIKYYYDKSGYDEESLKIRGNFFSESLEWMIEFPELISDEGKFCGFDVIIGNPPFISLQDMTTTSQMYAEMPKDMHRKNSKKLYSTYEATGDIYALFYERGSHLLKDGGYLCFITSNKWMRAAYGESLKRFFINKVNPLLLVDFAQVQLFDNVTVETNILLYSKNKNMHKCECLEINKSTKDNAFSDLYDYVLRNKFGCDFYRTDNWIIMQPVELEINKKIEAAGGISLSSPKWGLTIDFGCKTGLNDAFVINSNIKNQILINCKTDEEQQESKDIIKKVIKGENVGRYSYKWDDLWLIALFPSCKYDIEKLPAIKQWLLSYNQAKEKLVLLGKDYIANDPMRLADYCRQKLSQTGLLISVNEEPILVSSNTQDKARKMTKNKWFETQDVIAYRDHFLEEKLISKRIGSMLRVSYDDKQMFCLDSTCIITGKYLKYVCCILNSKLGHYIIYTKAKKTGTGDLLVSVQALEPIKLPIPKDEPELFNELLDKQLYSYSEETDQMINDAVYNLFNLSQDERVFIENFDVQFQSAK